MDYVGEIWRICEERQEKASALDGVADGGNTGALELIFVLEVPVLADAGLRLDAPRRLEGVEAVEAALGSPPLLLLSLLHLLPRPQRHLLDLSEAIVEEDKREKGEAEQGRASHG